MRKYLRYLIFLFLLIALAGAEPKYLNQPAATVYFRDSRLKFSSNPVLVENVLYVPIRDIADQMGLEFNYNNRQDFYEIKRAADFRSVVFKLHSTKIKINGQEDKLTYPVYLIKNQYYVPLNDFLWTLGYFVRIDGSKYIILTKIKDISWENRNLKITAEAPLEVKLTPLLSGYEITIFNTILGRHAEELEIEDGGVKRISYYQESLQPARIRVILSTAGRIPYTAFQEDSENSYLIKLNYQPLAKSAVSRPEISKTEIISKLPGQEISQPKYSTGARLFPSNIVLWLPEKLILSKNNSNFVLAGKLIQNIPLKSFNGVIYVPFNKIFSTLNCRLENNELYVPDGKKYQISGSNISGVGVNEQYNILKLDEVYVPLVQTLRLTGYGAYFSDNQIYINPRIYELAYLEDNNGSRLVIKANGRLAPKTITYLKNPYRCLIDIPYAAYDAPLNILRPQNNYCVQVRGAQFDRGIVRIVLELTDQKNKPVLTYTENNLLALVLDKKAVAAGEILIAQTPKLAPKVIQIEQEEVVPVEQVYSVSTAEESPSVSRVAETIQFVTQNVPQEPSEKFTAVKKPAVNIIKGLKIAILPGHGGEDVGAISRTGYMEKIPTLEVAKKLAKLLSDNGAVPLLCRDNDINVSLDNQAEFSLKNNADVLVSIHFNSFTDESVNGAESYYYKDIDYALARAVHDEIIRTTGVKNKGLKKAQMHNLNHTTMPGVLVEPAFMSNRKEEMLIKSDIYQWKLAKAIYRGIEHYLQNK